jgi:type I restriction enzyme M protein
MIGHERSPVDAGIILPIAGLLFFRWLDLYEAEQEAIAEFDGIDYSPLIPERLRWRSWCTLRGEKSSSFIDNELLPGIKNNHSSPLAHRTKRVLLTLSEFTRLSVEIRDSLLEWVMNLPFETALDRETVELVFESLLKRAFEPRGRMGTEFMTPDPVSDLMVELADPHPGERVYDPCFGIGGLLVKSVRHIKLLLRQMSPGRWADVQQRSIFGVEIGLIPYVITVTRVVLCGIDNPGLEKGDALLRPVGKNRSTEGFDCILAAPPWGFRHRGELTPDGITSAQYPFPVNAQLIETLFLQHVMLSLKPGGRAVIALPEGSLFRTGADLHVRKILLNEYRVEGVISLPENSFSPFSGVKANLLIFKREMPAEKVRFYVVDQLASDGDEIPGQRVISAIDAAAAFRKGEKGENLWESGVKDLAKRDWELVAKKPGDTILQRLLKEISKADKDIPVKTIGSVAKVFAGVSYQKGDLRDRPEEPERIVGLLRIADIETGKITSPPLFLSKQASGKIRYESRLLPGDVLLSVSGSIGKVGLVGNGGVGAVASKSLAVLRPLEGLSPHYMAALLQSESIQKWLEGHARGATIQHLSIRTLRHLPLPIPPIPVQELIAQKYRDIGKDAVSLLLQHLSKAEENPILTWLETSPETLEILKNDPSVDRKDTLPLFDRFAGACSRFWEEIAGSLDQAQIENTLAEWLEGMNWAARKLRGISQIPEDTGRLISLEEARAGIENACRLLQSDSGFHTRAAERLCMNLLGLILREKESLLANTRLHPSLEPEWVPTARESEVLLRVRNDSPLALRRVSVATRPSVGRGHVDYLREGGFLTVPLTIPATPVSGTFDLQLLWQAERLDGKAVSGEIPISIAIRPTRDAAQKQTLGANPYIVGPPVDRREMFIGRRDIIDRIRRQITTSHRANVVLLEGNRRTGKTSILKHFETERILSGWIVVYCSLQSGEGHESKTGLPTREVFRLMAREIGNALNREGVILWLPDQPPPDPKRHFKFQFNEALNKAFDNDHPFEVFETYVESAIKAILPRRLLLMLDEFDKLQEGIDSGITSPQVPENIRYLLHAHADLSAILTGTRRLKRLREEYWSALFGFGYRIEVGPLKLEDARELVTRPVEGLLTFVPQARDLVVELCARQPFLIQSLCSRIFDYAAETGERTISLNGVEAAANEMIRDNEHFRTLWNYAGTERRRLLLALCDRFAARPDPITLDFLEDRLEETGVIIPKGDRIGEDMEHLRELDIVRMDSTPRSSVYKLAIPLMARWIRHHIDFTDLVELARREGEEKSL